MKKHDGVEEIVIPIKEQAKKIYNPRGARDRRVRAKERLEAQLKGGIKREKFEDGSGFSEIPYTPADIKRIKKELEILKTRI